MQLDSYQMGLKSRELVKRSTVNPAIRAMQQKRKYLGTADINTVGNRKTTVNKVLQGFEMFAGGGVMSDDWRDSQMTAR